MQSNETDDRCTNLLLELSANEPGRRPLPRFLGHGRNRFKVTRLAIDPHEQRPNMSTQFEIKAFVRKIEGELMKQLGMSLGRGEVLRLRRLALSGVLNQHLVNGRHGNLSMKRSALSKELDQRQGRRFDCFEGLLSVEFVPKFDEDLVRLELVRSSGTFVVGLPDEEVLLLKRRTKVEDERIGVHAPLSDHWQTVHEPNRVRRGFQRLWGGSVGRDDVVQRRRRRRRRWREQAVTRRHSRL